jgi:CBS domain-containing protein
MAFLAQQPGVPTDRGSSGDYDNQMDIGADEADGDIGWQSAYFADLWDDVGADTSARFDSIANPEWDMLTEHDISEVMTRTPLHTVFPDDSAESAASLMQTAGIHRVLVIEDEDLVGILSSLDIARAAGDHRFATRTYVFNHDEDFGDRAR